MFCSAFDPKVLFLRETIDSPLHRQRNRIPSPKTKRRNPLLHIPPHHLVDQRHQHSRSTSPNRMTDRHCPAIHIHLLQSNPQLASHSQRLHTERLIQLIQIHLVLIPPSPLQHPPHTRHRS